MNETASAVLFRNDAQAPRIDIFGANFYVFVLSDEVESFPNVHYPIHSDDY